MCTTGTLDRTFAALADPTRRAILARLASGQASVTELAAPFAMSLPAVSKHLKVLERAGLVARGRRAQWRPAQLQAEPLHEVADWLADYRRFWEERLDRFDEYLRELQASEPDRGEPVQPKPAKKASTKARTKGREQ
ncbi:MAG TPA: metalloregulator ArsR/SmtB family transcription factor [Actinomycetota bacterium]|jgi:DNA-binding transcriptional ArsR family regulator|nr:metalloregulator ArsR/SmtB family transcription factor [Actinomycetota bacterium]